MGMEAPIRRNSAWMNQEGIITEVTLGIQKKKKMGFLCKDMQEKVRRT